MNNDMLEKQVDRPGPSGGTLATGGSQEAESNQARTAVGAPEGRSGTPEVRGSQEAKRAEESEAEPGMAEPSVSRGAPSGAPTAAAHDRAPGAGIALATEEPGLFAPVYPFPRLELVSGRGATVTDANGRDYLDFTSGIAVSALGHAPAGLARAVSRQMKTLTHCSNLFANRPAIALAQALVEVTGCARVFFCNSGTEGMDAAIKFARARAAHAGREGRDILAFHGGFHGRTGFALSATYTPKYREPFMPLIPGVRFAPYNDLAALNDALDDRVAAIVVEPVQGESGVIPAKRDFLQALRARATALGATLIFDEVQCGMGRCGTLLAATHYGVTADITVLSKALGGGIPLAAVLVNDEVAAGLAPGMHGTTFGGGPVATTAGLHVLEKVKKPSFLARVRRSGRRLMAGLEAIVAKHDSLVEARGLGLLTAVEVGAEAPYDAPALVRAARDQGLLLVRGGERAVRVLPPLTVKDQEIDEALARLDRAVGMLESGSGGENG